MPLINLQTNLKSLSYNGNGPYVQKDINNPGRPASEYIQGRVDDTTRMLRLLGDKGIAFTSKQALLLAGTKGLAAIPQAGNILANIVAQVPVNGTGTHFLPIDRNVYYTRVTDAAERSLYNGTVGGDNSPGTNNLGPFPEVTSRISETSKFKETTTPQSINALSPRDIYNTDQKTQPFRINTHRSARTRVLDDGTIVQPTNNISLDTQYGFAETAKSDTVGLQDVNNETLSDSVPIKFTLYNGTDITATLVFRGFIDSFSDDMSGNWESLRYIGRAEEMYTYGGFSRGINLNFQVPVLSSQEQTPTLNKINALKSAVLPQYKNDLPIATFCKLRIGDLIADDTTYVVLNSVNHSLDTDVPWSVGSDEKLLPQLYKLSISMKVLHKNIPQVWNSTTGRQFIGHNV
jgi:hypothetical protein